MSLPEMQFARVSIARVGNCPECKKERVEGFFLPVVCIQNVERAGGVSFLPEVYIQDVKERQADPLCSSNAHLHTL